MLGFDPLSLFAAGYILAASNGCPAPEKPAEVNIVLTRNDPVYVTNLTSEQLRQNTADFDRQAEKGTDLASRATAESRAETLQVMRQGGEIFTGGYMTGGFKARYEVSFKGKAASSGGSGVCVYVDKLTIEMIYSPAIYVASEYDARPCAKVVVTGHERNHMARDLLAISVSIPRAKETLNAYLAKLGGQGPYFYDEAHLSAARQAITQMVAKEMTAGIFDPLAMLRQQYQALLDTPQNYLRESTLCPSWQWKINSKDQE